MKKRVFCLILAALMLVGALPATALAEEAEETPAAETIADEALPAEEETAAPDEVLPAETEEEPVLTEQAQMISEITILGVNRPCAGDRVLSGTVTVPADAHYSIHEYGAEWYETPLGQSRYVPGTLITDPEYRFSPQHDYREEISFVPDAGYEFADFATITVHVDGFSRDEYTLNVYESGRTDLNYPNRTVYIEFQYPGFIDVMDSDAFYYRPVYWGADARGITTGWPDHTFRPWNTCNRASIVTFLWRMAGRPTPSSIATFSDMPADTPANSDFRNAISWAVERGITTGWESDNTFRPWNTCNRTSIITFIWRYMGSPKLTRTQFNLATRKLTDLPEYNTETDNDFRQAIAWGLHSGIITGWEMSDGTVEFRPWNGCNRASAMTFLWRLAAPSA